MTILADRWSAEQELLMLCNSISLNVSRIRELVQSPSFNWPGLFELAAYHRTRPILFWIIKKHAQDITPPESFAVLEALFLQNSKQSLEFANELIHILKHLEQEQIPALPFKGTVLAQMAYGSIILREAIDIDILIAEENAAETIRIMRENGFLFDTEFAHREERQYRRYTFEFDKVSPPIHVEIHWAFTQPFWPFPLRLRHLLAQTELVSLMGTEIKSIRTEELLIVLSVHGGKHFWRRLRWISDIAKLVDATANLDWDYTIRRAKELHAYRLFLVGLGLSHQLLGSPIPESVLRLIEGNRQVNLLIGVFIKDLFTKRWEHPSFLDERLILIRLKERPADRLIFTYHQILRPTLRQVTRVNHWDHEFIPLPKQLSFLYYAIRPIRLVIRYTSHSYKRLIKHFIKQDL